MPRPKRWFSSIPPRLFVTPMLLTALLGACGEKQLDCTSPDARAEIARQLSSPISYPYNLDRTVLERKLAGASAQVINVERLADDPLRPNSSQCRAKVSLTLQPAGSSAPVVLQQTVNVSSNYVGGDHQFVTAVDLSQFGKTVFETP